MKPIIFNTSVLIVLCAAAYAELGNLKDASPIRSERKVAISLELAWNGLAGLGPVMSYYPIPNVGMDCGLGMAGAGYKFGVRGRYLFHTSNLTPFLGGGVTQGSGTMGQEAEVEDQGSMIKFTVKSSTYLLFGGGIENITRGGFLFQFHAGYALLLGGKNYEITQGTASSVAERSIRLSTGGGPTGGISLGYAIK